MGDRYNKQDDDRQIADATFDTCDKDGYDHMRPHADPAGQNSAKFEPATEMDAGTAAARHHIATPETTMVRGHLRYLKKYQVWKE